MNTYAIIWRELRALYEARSEPESMRPLAQIYWRAILSLSLILIVLVLAWGAWVFVGVLSALSSGTAASVTPPVALDRKQLQGVLASFEQRSQQTETLKASTAKIVDPSK